MKLLPEDLPYMGYHVNARLQYNELIPFVQEGLKKKNVISFLHILVNVLVIAWAAFVAIYVVSRDFVSAWIMLVGLLGGMSITLILIPIHEILHGLAYKLMGAKDIRYAADWKRFYFMAIAHRFVANRTEFFGVAFLPFIVINTMLITLIALSNPHFWPLLSGTLVMHTAACSGDFGLASRFLEQGGREMLTWDDADNKESWFMSKTTHEIDFSSNYLSEAGKPD
jgi:hypothetical protein